MTCLMSEPTARKFTEKARLASRSLPEIKKAVDAAVSRLKWDESMRVGGEQYSITALVNGVVAWWLVQLAAVQDKVVAEGVKLCNERLASPDEIPLAPPARPKGRK